MTKINIKLLLSIAGIVALGQSCAKDMTTQDFNAELAKENQAKMQDHAAAYTGPLKYKETGQVVGPLTVTVGVQNVNPGSNNNASQNVGFGGVMEIDVQGEPQLRLSYANAYFDFSDAGNYSFNPKVTMPDGTTSDTVEVTGQFPDNNTMIGELHPGNFSDLQYVMSFSLTRNGPAPAPASLSSFRHSGLVLSEGANTATFAGTATYGDGTTSPMNMQLVSKQTSDDAFYAFVSPDTEIDVLIVVNPQNPYEVPIAWRNIVYDTIHGVFSGTATNANNLDTTLSCSQPDGSNDWNCSTTTLNRADEFSVTFAPAN